MKCPHCKRIILSTAQQEVLKLARKPQTIVELAWEYGSWRNATHRSSRRAVGRLVQMRLLVRVRPGMYRAKKG